MDLYKANNDVQKYGKEFLNNMKDLIKPPATTPTTTNSNDKQEPQEPPRKKQKTTHQNIPENSLLIHYVDGKYISTEGVEFVPSMKALCNTQEEVAKVVVKKEDEDC